jgi:hypothetical protein
MVTPSTPAAPSLQATFTQALPNTSLRWTSSNELGQTAAGPPLALSRRSHQSSPRQRTRHQRRRADESRG